MSVGDDLYVLRVLVLMSLVCLCDYDVFVLYIQLVGNLDAV